MMEELQKVEEKCEWLRDKVDEQSDEMKRLGTQVALLEQENKDLRHAIVLDLEKEQALVEMWHDYPLKNWPWVCHLGSTLFFEKGTKHWRDIEKKLRREGRFLAWGATGKSQRCFVCQCAECGSLRT